MTTTSGDGRRGCDMGPLVTAAARGRVVGYIDAGVADGSHGGINQGFPQNL